MLFRFSVKSEESDEFLREIKIDADATFLDFCQAILKSCGYSDDQVTSFRLTDEEWNTTCEVTREDMGGSPYDVDVYVMEETSLRSLIDDEGQRMKFVFDTFNDREFYIELKEIATGHPAGGKAELTRSIGEAPPQIVVEEKPAKAKKAGAAQRGDDIFSDESFYGSDGFNDDDLSNEGLDVSEGLPGDDAPAF